LAFKKFKLPASLKGKVFLADEFFDKKKNPVEKDFLSQNLKNTKKILKKDGHYIHRRIEIPLNSVKTAEGYIYPEKEGELCLNPESLALLSGDEDWDVGDSPNLVFLDTETTGLSGGTGTYPFLCGIGYFEKQNFVVEQFFMEDYPFEVTMLEALSKKLKEADAFVTFNGKSFDIPLLSTRFIYNRLRINLDIPHIDLLHPSRRIWRGTFPNCRLETIEKEFFDLHREKDVESSLIPMIYFNYVRGRKQDLMLPVFDHNVQDIVTLGALLSFLCRILSGNFKDQIKKPAELWGLGRLFLKYNKVDMALMCHEEALKNSNTLELRKMLLSENGWLYKKLHKWDKAIMSWEELMQISPKHRMEAATELAKYYEHRKKDPIKAKNIIIEALKGMELSKELESYISGMEKIMEKEFPEEIKHRLERLERKIQNISLLKNVKSSE
jgi:uncharacterized protein